MDVLHTGFMLFCAVVLLVALAATAGGAPPDVPEGEKEMLNTVDPWGLPFSDQLSRFEGHFGQAPDAPYALGVTHDLVKVWPVKYWFRGETVAAGNAEPLQCRERIAAAGETQSFQVAVLPRVGADEKTYSIMVEAPGAEVTVYRQVFLSTSDGAAYPRYSSERWPDPLFLENEVTVGGTDCGVFWIDVRIPADAPSGTIDCAVSVSDGDTVAAAQVPVRVVAGLQIDPKAFPFVAWFRRSSLTEEQFRDLCALVLDHHVVPIDALKGQWDAKNPSRLDDMRAFLEAHDQRIFEVDSPRDAKFDFDSLYAHLKEKGWVDDTWVYSYDEPDEEMWREKNVPFMKMVRDKYPGIRAYVASDWHDNMGEGVDAWMTDISASGYDPDAHRELENPQLWHYYCHLPIRWQMRAPLVEAPNMQIDNPALEQRLAIWVSHYYGAKVVFIWSGNAGTFGDEFWKELKLPDKPSGYPYAGVHNGNGWVVYPKPDGSGTIPSLRLKLIRDGLEDVALMETARKMIRAGKVTGADAVELAHLVDPVPGVFVHTHYFDRLPETLVNRREAVLRLLAKATGQEG